jgi:uncharacterized protein
MAVERATFPLPDVDDPLIAPYFERAARGELAVPRCDACGQYIWYPQPRCPVCDRDRITWQAVSGRGSLFSWAVVRRAFLPAFAERVPFVSALVALVEDPAVRIVSYVVDAEPAALVPDMPMTVRFRPLTFPTVPDHAVVVPMFTPSPS